MGSVRADAVMVWPALLIGLSGLLGSADRFWLTRSSPTLLAQMAYQCDAHSYRLVFTSLGLDHVPRRFRRVRNADAGGGLGSLDGR